MAQGERGVVVAPDQRGVFLARSLKQQRNVGQNRKSGCKAPCLEQLMSLPGAAPQTRLYLL